MTEVVEQVEQRDEALMNEQTSAMSSVTLAERVEYQTYERARRRRLLAAIAPAGVILAGLACLVATASLIVNPQQDASVWVNDALTFALAISFALAWVALRRGRLGAASTIA